MTAEPRGELKTAEIAGAAHAYTLLISYTATEQAERAKRKMDRSTTAIVDAARQL